MKQPKKKELVRIQKLIDQASFRFARTMPHIPHWYSMREQWQNDDDFVDVILFIREHGVEEEWHKRKFIYFYYGDFKYWTMGNPVCRVDKKKTYILNRAKV